ncbi:MAG: teichoic acid transporter [Microbacterium sp.]|nr:MAG: teichoic acid transporter [Microbacterium sp.]PZU35481.1 MAG: teichoic acid transporter [Microbacterium sp.]
MSKTAGTSSMFSGAAKNFLGNVVGPLAGLASAPILAHALGAERRGEVAGATAPLLLFATVAAVGIPDAVTYFVARQVGRHASIAWRSVVVTLVSGLVATVLAIALAPVLAADDPALANLVVIASFAILPTILVGVFRAIAAGQGRWGLVSIERASGPIVRLLAVIALVTTGHLTVFTATVAIAYSPVLAGIVYFALRWRQHGVTAAPPSYRQLLGYSSRAWLGSIAGVILMRIDQVAMVPLSSTYELGLYVVAVTVGELPLIVNTAIREVVFAADARSSSNESLTRAARVSFFVCLAMAVVMGGTSFWWVPIAFGDEFAAAVPTILVLLVAVVIGVPGSVAGAGLGARGKPQLRSYALIIACIVNVVLVIVLVPLLGAVGAALATLIGNLVSSNFNIVQMRVKFGVPISAFYLIRGRDVTMLVSKVAALLRRR